MSEVSYLTARYVNAPHLGQIFWNISWKLKNKKGYFYQLILERYQARFIAYPVIGPFDSDEDPIVQNFYENFLSWHRTSFETLCHTDFAQLIQKVQGNEILVPYSAWAHSVAFQQSFIPKE